jgi:hypothetical protein
MIVPSPKLGEMVSYPKPGEATEDSNMEKLDEEIHRLIKQPGAACSSASAQNSIIITNEGRPSAGRNPVAVWGVG